MSFFQHLREEKYKLILSSLTTSIGFFVALLANSAVEHYHDKETYLSMRKAIQIEAVSNEKVLHESFEKYYANGVVLQEFSIGVVTQSLSNVTFLKNSPSTEIADLSSYVRNLGLANKYRDRSEKWRLSDTAQAWSEDLKQVWKANLEVCATSIATVSNLQGVQ